MNVFYYSVHQVLEDDEVKILQSLGHNVFCLGCSTRRGSFQPFRPQFSVNEAESWLYDEYERLGGKYIPWSRTADDLLPPGFMDHFSVAIVMHDIDFISRQWAKLEGRAVVWRTIGQNLDHFEPLIEPYRRQGIKILRYSPKEAEGKYYLGADACIRFYKDPDVYRGWQQSTQRFLTFSNHLQQRYPLDAFALRAFAQKFPIDLGGTGNAAFDQSIGVVDWTRQIDLFRSCAAYFYFTGIDIPYTLSFIEAWMTGVPLLIYAPTARVGPYFEIGSLVEDGVNGFLCGTFKDLLARAACLIEDPSIGRSVGEKGRAAAMKLFGKDAIRDQWRDFLSAICPAPNTSSAPEAAT